MFDFGRFQQCAARLQVFNHDGIGPIDVMAFNHGRTRFKDTGIADRIECLDAIFHADFIVLLAMTGSCVYSARASVQSDMVANENRRILMQIGMTEDTFIQLRTIEVSHGFTLRPDSREYIILQILGQNQRFSDLQVGIVTGIGDVNSGIFDIRTDGNSHVGGDGPRRGGPDNDGYITGQHGMDIR